MTELRDAGSFRDPAGFVFHRDGILLRQVNLAYAESFDRLISSGLYQALAGRRLLVSHEEVPVDRALTGDAYKVLQPEVVPFISYPYEWTFGQLKAAALLTLEVQKVALEHGMVLRDASAYNVQFFGSAPRFIDTLSFERYAVDAPWAAYRQFCQHFLAPLALMSLTDVRLGQLLRSFIDGIPLDLAAALLPKRSLLSPGLLMHVHLHSRSQRRYGDSPGKAREARVSAAALRGILASLQSAVNGLTWRPGGTEWADYYSDTNYDSDAFERKRRVVAEYLEMAGGRRVWDLGANRGVFSRLASGNAEYTVAFDLDPGAVEHNYREGVRLGERSLLPLLMDLTNPSPGLGWEGAERSPLVARGPADVVMALALVHHLAIGNNVPLTRIAELFSRLGTTLIIEFVPKEDSQVKRLLAARKDVFPDYSQAGFEDAFRCVFATIATTPLAGTHRTLYLMRVREPVPA
jgi:hypothetical protein